MQSHNQRGESGEAVWKHLVALSALLPATLDAALQSEAGLNHFEFQVLEALDRAEGNFLRMSALAAETNTTLPRLSHVVTRMAKRGLVRRSPCPEDRRATNAVLTAEGASVYSAAVPTVRSAARQYLFDVLSPEQISGIESAAEDIVKSIRQSPECSAVSSPSSHALP